MLAPHMQDSTQRLRTDNLSATPKGNRVLSYKKCSYCRKHKQKCLPEGRQWPGERCLRCEKYGYDCSASLKKPETDAASKGNSADLSNRALDHESGVNPPNEAPIGGYGAVTLLESTRDCITELSDLTLLEESMRVYIRVSDCWEERFETIRNEVKACLSRLHHLLRSKAAGNLAAGKVDEAATIYRCLYRDAALPSWATYEFTGVSQEAEFEQVVDLQYVKEDMVQVLCKQYEIVGDYITALRLCEHAYFRKPEPKYLNDFSGQDLNLTDRPQARLANCYHEFIRRVRGIHPGWELMANISTLYSFARALKRSPQVWNGVLPIDWRSSLLKCAEGKYLADSMPALAMYIATFYDLPDLLRALFPGQWLTLVSLRDRLERTALHMASELGSYAVARFLIDIRADADDTDFGEDTPLHLACAQKQMALIPLLIDAGANVNARNSENSTPLHSLLMSPSEGKAQSLMKPIISYLLNANAKPEYLDDTNHNALHYAARHGQLEVVKLLTPNPFCLGNLQDQETSRGYTPLHYAINSGMAKVALHLIKQGHDVHTTDYEGGTPLHLACCHLGGLPASEVIECLLGHGAFINKSDKQLNTPLHYAAYWGKVNAVKTLLGRGAAINLCNDEGETPSIRAHSQGRIHVCNILDRYIRFHEQFLIDDSTS